MALGIIELLEIVQIEQDQCSIASIARADRHRLLQTLQQQAPIRQLGQRIVERQLMDVLFFLPAFGDIEEGRHRADDLSILGDGMRPVFHGNRHAIPAPEHLVVAMRGLVQPESLIHDAILRRIGRPVGMRVMDQGVDVFAQHLLHPRITQDFQEGGVGKGAIALVIHAIHPFRHRVEQALQLLLGILLVLLRRLALANVAAGTIDIAVGQAHGIQFERDLFAGVGQQADLVNMPPGFRHDLAAHLAVDRAPVGRHQVEDGHGIQFAAFVAEQLDHVVVDIEDAPVRLDDENSIRRTLQGHAQALLAFAQRRDHGERRLFRFAQQLMVFLIQLLQFGGILACHAPVEQARQHAAAEPEQCSQRHHDGEDVRLDAQAIHRADRLRCDVQSEHRGVMHGRDRQPQRNTAQHIALAVAQLAPERVIHDIQSAPGGGDGNQHGNQEDQRVVTDGRRHLERGHADVMHAADADPHQDCAEQQAARTDLGIAQHPEPDQGRDDGRQQRQQRQFEVIPERDRQMESQHAHEVHGPHRRAQCCRPGQHPDVGGVAVADAHAPRMDQRGIGADHGQHHRQHNQINIPVDRQNLPLFNNPFPIARPSLLQKRGLTQAFTLVEPASYPHQPGSIC